MQGAVASRNTQQALDWATKRRLQVERASRLRSERQVLLKADRLSATDFADEEPSESARHASAPIAGRRAQTSGYEDGFARSYSQPGGDLLMANGGGGANTQRPASEEPGRLGRRAHYGGVPDGVAEPQQRPEWAREMSASARPTRFGDGYDGYDGGAGGDNGASPPDEGVRQRQPSAERKSGRAPQPENWDWFRDEQDGRGGGYPRGPPPPVTSTKHEAAVAAAAARFPDDIPLTQSDGAIGFSRQRALPRAMQPQTQQQQVRARRRSGRLPLLSPNLTLSPFTPPPLFSAHRSSWRLTSSGWTTSLRRDTRRPPPPPPSSASTRRAASRQRRSRAGATAGPGSSRPMPPPRQTSAEASRGRRPPTRSACSHGAATRAPARPAPPR